ncbi:MAG: hypothetical protein QM496_14280 [Verrucomicrobiota bacterium]
MIFFSKRGVRAWTLFLYGIGAGGFIDHLHAQQSGAASGAVLEDLPPSVEKKNFSELMKNSPFTRSLDLSDSLILTGVAKVDGKTVATLINKETKETYVISEHPNAQGWKMVGINEGEDLEKVTAKIALSGGEVVTVRFDESRLKPGEAKPAAGPGGEKKEGKDERRRRKHGGPPPEVMAKLKKLSDEQRGKLREYMTKKMQGSPDMTTEERRALLGQAVERLTAGNK